MSRPSLLPSLSRWLPFNAAPPSSTSPAERAHHRAREALEAFQLTGGSLVPLLDTARHRQAPQALALQLGAPPVDQPPVGLVLRASEGHGLHLQARPSALPLHRPPEVTVGLIDGTLAPGDLHDLLRLIRQIKRHDQAVKVYAPFGSWLQETLLVAGRLLDQAQAGLLHEDVERAVIQACVDLAPHASFRDMDLGALCAFHFYCRAAFPANETADAQRRRRARDTPAHDPARSTVPGVRRTLRAAPHVAAARPGAAGPA